MRTAPNHASFDRYLHVPSSQEVLVSTTDAATHRHRADLLRKVSGSTGICRTMRKAVRVLAEAGIASLVVGGYAVQENGYARFTSDVDIVVPDIAAAKGVLTLNGFRENPGSSMTVTDRTSKVEVNLLPGGGSVGPGPLLLPMPERISTEPNIADLRTLIEIKLSSYLGSPIRRSQDIADVVALIRANRTPRAFALHPSVVDQFLKTWDGLLREASR
jgi:hypothetical protein